MELTQLLYIDPAATSVLLTSLTAIVVAVGASAIVIWRKFKKKVDKTLNKDPNANKEIEEELVIVDEETKTEDAAEAAETAEKVEEPVETTEPAAEEKAPEAKAKSKKQK
ncbi:MAG: hypothetical protein K2N22_05960 [Clostridia bacterium]|nr:hypothetical protein [Clostridia bacterium]